MAVDVGRSELELPYEALDALSRAAALIASGGPLAPALAALAEAAGRATGADLAIVRVLDPSGEALVARAVAPPASALAAELEGSRVPLADVPGEFVAEHEGLPAATRRAAEHMRAGAALFVPAQAADRLVGSVELLRAGEAFGAGELAVARLAASQLAVAVAMLRPETRSGQEDGETMLE